MESFITFTITGITKKRTVFNILVQHIVKSPKKDRNRAHSCSDTLEFQPLSSYEATLKFLVYKTGNKVLTLLSAITFVSQAELISS